MQDSAIKNPDFQPGANWSNSHCIEGTCKIGREFGGVDTTPLGPASGGFYNANTQAANLSKAAADPTSGWVTVPLADAQKLANQGKFVVIAWADPNGGHGHTVTVRPDFENKKAETNPSLAQIGGSTGNGVMPFRNTFGASKREAVVVYVYKGNQ